MISVVLYDIARVERDLGHLKEADRDFQRCLGLREKILGPASPEVAATLDAYALLLRRSGRDTEASAIEARARAIPHPPESGGAVVFTPTQ